MKIFKKTVLYLGRLLMSHNRITKETAELISIPPTEWEVKTVSWLLDQEVFAEKYVKIPLNETLMESIKRDGIISPMLVMPNWYPICGSQRLRACKHIQYTDPTHKVLDQSIRVARFEKEWWNAFYLWPNEEDKNKCIQIYFQTMETAWKSKYFIHEKDFKGKDMIRFEEEGNELKWEARDGK